MALVARGSRELKPRLLLLMREQALIAKTGVVDDPFGDKAHCLACRDIRPAAGFSVCSRCSNVRYVVL